MLTKYWNVTEEDTHRTMASDFKNVIAQAATLLRAGKVVAFPTETVYGLGADARSDVAVQRIFTAKGRPQDNPLIVHIADKSQLAEFVDEVPDLAERLMERFWPGPLTIVLPLKKGMLSSSVTAGLSTVGVRMPDHPLALQFINEAGCPVAAPSANRSGRPSPTTAQHVLEDMDGQIEGILDGGPCDIGLESTVVEIVGNQVHILRPGSVTSEQLVDCVDNVVVQHDEALRSASREGLRSNVEELQSVDKCGFGTVFEDKSTFVPRSPGIKYRHYAPQGTMTLVVGQDRRNIADYIQRAIDDAKRNGERTGVLAFQNDLQRSPTSLYEADVVVACGSLHDSFKAAKDLYAGLRKFDHEKVTFIMSESCSEEGIGHAIMNRLRKASDGRVVQV